MQESKGKVGNWYWVLGIGFWVLGIWNWILGIGKTLSQFPVPNPQSPVPSSQSPVPNPFPYLSLARCRSMQFLTNQVVGNVCLGRNVGVAINFLEDCINNPVKEIDYTLVTDGTVAV